ncbi:glycosyltransferase family 4 protein [Candidatus Saccharibacteria bacterium]|nr:glycosyltransferase family 4 protein [Candidatus Saccharibacteria bacterium]MCL1962900.1 glycosyltransferase family 4 protein [Candidatus Saccharibacteria bacterium]
MKILILLPSENITGGADRAAVQLIDHMIEKGMNPILIFRGGGNFRDYFADKDVKTYIVPCDWWIHGIQDARGFDASTAENAMAISKIVDIIEKNKPDATMTYTIDMPWLAYASKVCGVPHVCSIHELVDDKRAWRTRLPAEHIIEIMDKLSVGLVVNSEWTKLNYEKYNLRNKLLVNYPMSIDKVQIDERSKGNNPFDDNSFNIVLVGNVQRIKNQLDAVKAIERLKKCNMFPNLYLIGSRSDREYYNDIKKYVRENGLHSQVKFTGFKKEPLLYTKNADISLMCSSVDSFGLVTLESIALGVPTISAKAGGSVEIIDDEKNGYFYNAGDADDLADRIKYVYDNMEAAKAKARVASKNVCKKYDLESNYKSLFKLLCEVKPLEMELYLADITAMFDGIIKVHGLTVNRKLYLPIKLFDKILSRIKGVLRR